MNKKTLIIISGVVVFLLVGVGIYFFLQKDAPGTSKVRNLLPFGLGGSDTEVGPVTPPNNPVVNTSSEGVPIAENGLRKISDGPVSGSTMLVQGSTTLVRFMDRATGNIYEYDPLTNSKKRLTNTTIPKAVHVVWGLNANSFIAQTIKGDLVSSYSGTIASSTASSTADSLREVTGEYIPDDITSISFSPKKDSVFYLQKTNLGISGFIADKKGKNAKEVWRFPTNEWLLSWQTGDTAFISTKSSSGLESFLYTLNTRTGALSLVLGHIEGLLALPSPNSDQILFSESKTTSSALFLYSVKQKISLPQPFTAFAEKCTWITNTKYTCGVQLSGITGKMLDEWHMGLFSFDDSLATYDTNQVQSDDLSENLKIIEIRDTDGKGIDVINLQTSADGRLLSFQNKKDLSLWVLPINTN